MDLTEAFRNEDISKTDFFDFVVTPDVAESHQTLNFNRTLKSMGIFIDNPSNNNNNNVPSEFLEMKEEETNNNHVMMLPSNDQSETMNSVVGNFVDHPFWASTCDKETVRLETAILEDLNKFCWNQEPEIIMSGGETITSNTDGAIYTLTVLNGDHTTATWYRAPETAQLLKDDDITASPHNLEQLNPQSSLDLDSILSIIPNHSQNPHQYHQDNEFETSLAPLNNNDLMKSEYTYDDSGYTTKDSTNSIILTSELLDSDPTFNNNNNDWKLSDNNPTSSAESLLRNALQGKSLIGRYNGPKNGVKPLESHTELRRALNTPSNGSKTPPTFIAHDDDMDMKHSPLLVMDQNSVIFEEARVLAIGDSDNPSSTQSMDDILLSQLDAASYPEDYEKLKRIANEVAESVSHYCNLDQVGSPQSHVFTISSLNVGMSSNATLTTPTKSAKKYNRNKQANGASKAAHVNQQVHSNGVRKERSLHHCSICSKGFKDKYSVNVHIRTHTGEKPFACSLCGKSFRQKAHLAKHYQTHIAQKNAAANNNNNNNGPVKSGNKRFKAAAAT